MSPAMKNQVEDRWNVKSKLLFPIEGLGLTKRMCDIFLLVAQEREELIIDQKRQALKHSGRVVSSP